MHGEKQVFLIGHSAGGAAVASYVTSQPSNPLVQAAVVLDAPLAANAEEEVDWMLNGLLNSAYRGRDLTIPTLLIYGENDFVQDQREWLDRARANLTDIQLYSYEHNPWDSGVDPAVRTHCGATILACIVRLYCLVPEMPSPALAFISILLAIAILTGRRNLCPG
jgi:pimeloyl-ACP methyl ester carboxylesterase